MRSKVEPKITVPTLRYRKFFTNVSNKIYKNNTFPRKDITYLSSKIKFSLF